MRHLNKLWAILFCLITSAVKSQTIPGYNCPPNIGFESGTFNNWECFSGVIQRDGTLNLSPTSATPERHTIVTNSPSQELDLFGGFPVNCPNGSGYSVRLGSITAGGQAESVSYTFNIPPDQNDYSILYNYAVVFQNPPHNSWEQPRFQSRVYNVTDNKYIECGSFEFIASGGLPGFQLSTVGNNVYFKPWSPVTVNLSNLAGKTVRLEFFTNDCAFTQHFGYAYLDVNEDCASSPISGSTYCEQPESVTLTAPFGFATYNWYTSDFSKLLGSENILTIAPAPPANTTYALVITPYDGLGCQDTLYSKITVSSEPFKFKLIEEITGCSSGIDLTAAAITAGSTPGLTYSYYTNPNQTEYVPLPSKVTTSGIYYIKAVNKIGCNDIKPIKVIVKEPPNLKVTSPAGVCMPQKIDITAPEITAGSENDLILSYWEDVRTTIPLSNPKSITVSGTYYIMGKKEGGCGAVQPVYVQIGEIPNIVIHNPTGCGTVDITDDDVTAGSTAGINYTYWTDAATTISLSDPNNITASGTYYIKSSASSGCSITRPVSVTVNPVPGFIVSDPVPVAYPVITVDLTSAVPENGLVYTYWTDSLTRRPVANPRAINKRGRYFIRGTNQFGCSLIKAVNAVIIPPPEPLVYVPNAFTPNNDGLNDVFRIKIIGEISINHLSIYNRWGQLVYNDPNLNNTWNGKLKGLELPSGVYIWTLGGNDTYFKKPFMHKGLITLVR